ncbi:DinB family protein [Sneathiella aquimaris]|uniref:DinB family protein n=1 Tax=Sneathiella aquimaris TaxID=2599305 RepID=UPI00146CEEB8|nr:DinB family protein [Sneathiella aquimaris]
MIGHYRDLSGYNTWANQRLFNAIQALSDAQQNMDVGGFFGSLNGTLNHILVGDLLWLERLEGKGEKPASLDAVLHGRLDDLWRHRRNVDHRLEHYCSVLTDDKLNSFLDYKTSAGIPCHDNVAKILTHIFNHQTHHRGQCHHMLGQLDIAPPPLDIIYYFRENP